MSSQLQVSGEAKIRDIQGPVVANSGVITALDGAASQYVRGDGTLADFPTSTGGGSSVSYYLNSSVSQGTIGGVAYRELSKEPIIGAGTDIAIAANGYVASYITDANDPDVLSIPGGNFNCEFYFSVNNNTGDPFFYAELYKYDGSTFTLLGSSVGIPEYINQGTIIAPYYFAIPVPTSALALTDRLAIRIYVNVDGRTVTLHTENSHLCQVVTTLSKGMVSLNNLTDQSQFITTGTSGTDFNIVSSGDTHTFNIPSASLLNRGLITTGTQTIAGAKTFSSLTNFTNGLNAYNGLNLIKDSIPSSFSGALTSIYSASGDKNLVIQDSLTSSAKLQFQGSSDYTYTFPASSGTVALTSNLSSYLPLTGGVLTGALGINSNGLTGYSFRNSKNLTGFSTTYANSADGIIQSDATGISHYYFSEANVAAGASIIGIYHFKATQNLFGAGSSVAVQAGLVIDVSLSGAGTNYGIISNIPSAANNWNLYIGGSAKNWISSSLGIGAGAVNPTATLDVNGTFKVSGAATFSSSVTANSLVKSGGTSSQFLKADGSVDSTTYQAALTNPITGTGTRTTTYLPLFSGTNTITNSSISQGEETGVFVANSLSVQNPLTVTSYVTADAFIPTDSTVPSNGMYRSAANTLAFSTNSANRLTISSSGAATFSNSVTATGGNRNMILGSVVGATGYNFITLNSSLSNGLGMGLLGGATGDESLYINSGNGGSVVLRTGNGTTYDTRLLINSSGNVGIGTSSPKTLLQINGGSGAYPTLGTNVTNSIFVGRNDGVIGMYLGYAADGNGWIQQMRNDSATAAYLILQPSGGNVGIGTSSPTSYSGFTTLNINNATNGGLIDLLNNGTRVGTFFNTSSDVNIGSITSVPFIFYTANTERMRITSGGSVLINTTSDTNTQFTSVASATNYVALQGRAPNNTTAAIIQSSSVTTGSTSWYAYVAQSGNGSSVTTNTMFVYGNGNIVNVNNSYGTLSDVSLKENIVDATPKLDDLLQLKVRNFNLIGDENKQIGFIAQEFEEVFPKMVDVDGKSGNKLIKTSVLVPMLVKATQEIVEKYDNKIALLEAQIEELKQFIKNK